MTERHFIRHLVVAVLLKLMVLAGLWWWFVRDQQLRVDGDATAAHVTSSVVARPTAQGAYP